MELHPTPRQGAVVSGGKWRVTVLTDRLLRLEYDDDGRFTDSATQTVICRDFPVPEFTVRDLSGGIELTTGRLRLTYDGLEFSPEGLRIDMLEPARHGAATWRYGQKIRMLGGTARTLDNVDGATELRDSLMSFDGFAVLDDSSTALLNEDMWSVPRPRGASDIYFFGYGHDYAGCLRDFYRLCGGTPLLPRYALGNWWSRYYVYSEDTYTALMEEFRARRVPLTVAVVDMDWHLTRIPPRCGTGWTGYTWDRELFPDPARFLGKLRDMDLKVTLNLHPAEGVGAHEDAYTDMCRALDRDPSAGERIPFEAADRRYMEAYFKYLHHPLEDQGVDFWWIDWQQGTGSAARGIDPLWVLNHLHYLDSGRDGRWPLILSRYAGVGSHRYPIGFSGDTHVTWASLDFQPYFTASASNVGYTWWSHDIGGHMCGIRDDELTARWVELGVFSPIMRLHSTASEFTGKEPWRYGPEAERAMTDFMRLRRRLIPYLYSMNYLTYLEGQPLVRPMYYIRDLDDAYRYRNEYMFGTEMIVCPITRPADRETLMGCTEAWLPEGDWFDFFNGRIYDGGRRLRLHRTLDQIPVLVRAGGIVPLDADGESNGAANPERIELRVYPGADGSFKMYEDSGEYGAQPAVTRFDLKWGARARLTAEVTGDSACIPEDRTYAVRVMDVARPEHVSAENWTYDPAGRTLTVELAPGRGGFSIDFAAAVAGPDPVGQVFDILSRAQMDYNQKNRVYSIVRGAGSTARILTDLTLEDLRPELYSAVAEVLTARE